MAFVLLPPLRTARLLVRVVEERDLPDLLAVNGDALVTAFLPYAPWATLADGQAWLTRMQAMHAAGTGCQMVVVAQATQQVVGGCLLFRFEEGSRRAELGYVLGRAHWGQGVMREALTAVLGHVLKSGAKDGSKDSQLRRIEAEINPANLPSNKLARALGFTCEGVLRQRWTGRGPDALSYDINFYGLLASEWPSSSAAPE